jgi:hypothetical protein
MVDVYGNNIIGAYTGGVAVNEIWCHGVKVWPTEPVPGEWYIRWAPSNISGFFTIDGVVYNLEDYNGYFSDFSGVITSDAFRNNSDITYLKTNASKIEDTAFYSCYSLSVADLPSCEWLDNDVFQYCSSLKSVSLPVCSVIGPAGGGFGHTALESVYFPECNYLVANTFGSCYSLRTVDLPKCGGLDMGIFIDCSALTSVSLPECSVIGAYVFQGCKSLPSISLPVCSYIGNYAFSECESLSRIDLPECKYIGNNAFRKCFSLTSIDLPVCSYIGSTAFYNCVELSLVILRSDSVCQLGSNAFNATPIQFSRSSGQILVPSSLVSAYKSAPNWSNYSSRIYPITT